jgi:O-acetyl-ADP-ribose deacetylase (regulator of RNase III)
MIKAYKGNLFDYIDRENIDTLFSAANGIGPMGLGIAGAIRKYGGIEIQTEAFKICKSKDHQPGDAYRTNSGGLHSRGVLRIIHAVTMKNPGGKTSYYIIKKAFASALTLAMVEGSNIIGCTALGTGVGGLDPKKVAENMYEIALRYQTKLNIFFIDINPIFIENICKISKGSNCGKL